jgi:hypothetical protein
MPLDEATIMSAAPREKPFKLLDGSWLYLVVNPSGRKFWRLEFHLRGRERTLGLGDYPGVTLQAARDMRNEALLAMREGRNFHEWKAAQMWQRAEKRSSFKSIALDFLAQMESQWPQKRRENSIRWLEAHIFPAIGERPLSQIEPGEVLKEIHKIAVSGDNRTAASVRALCIQVFKYGVSCDACSRDTVAALRGLLFMPASMQVFRHISAKSAIVSGEGQNPLEAS